MSERHYKTLDIMGDSEAILAEYRKLRPSLLIKQNPDWDMSFRHELLSFSP